MKEKTIIIYNSVDYFRAILEKRKYHVFNLYKDERNYLHRIVKRILGKLNLNEHFIYDDWKSEINNAETIIIFAPIYEKSVNYIKSKNPNIKIISWYWNAAYKNGKPNKFVSKETDGWSFDIKHAKNYNFKYNNTFYFSEIKLKKIVNYKYDIIFVGREKYRKQELFKLKKEYELLGLKTFFHIVPNRGDKNPEKIKIIPYNKYLDLLSQSKIILDRLPPLQKGLTLRAMESIFLNKKLITDNIEIVKEPFYNPKNIYILNYDSKDSFSEFLETPYQPIKRDILLKYDFDSWLKRILSKKEFKYD